MSAAAAVAGGGGSSQRQRPVMEFKGGAGAGSGSGAGAAAGGSASAASSKKGTAADVLVDAEPSKRVMKYMTLHHSDKFWSGRDPDTGKKLISPRAVQMALFIPRAGMYNPSAVQWSQTRKDPRYARIVQNHRDLLEWFGLIAEVLSTNNKQTCSGDYLMSIATITLVPRQGAEYITEDDALTLDTCQPRHNGVRVPSMEERRRWTDAVHRTEIPTGDEVGMILTLSWDDTGMNDDLNLSHPKYGEEVEKRLKNRHPAHIVNHQLNIRASELMGKALRGTKRTYNTNLPSLRYQEATKTDYINAISFYHPSSLDHIACERLDITSEENPANPLVAFDLKVALSLAKRAGGSESFCSMDNWAVAAAAGDQTEYRFPFNGRYTYRAALHDLGPRELMGRFFIHAPRRALQETDPQVQLLAAQYLSAETIKRLTASLPADAEGQARVLRQIAELKQMAVERARDELNATGQSAGSTNGLADLRERISASMAEAMKAAGSDFKARAEARRKVQLSGIREFFMVFQPDGPICKSYQAIALYMDEFLNDNGGKMRMPTEKQTQNLDSFGESMFPLPLGFEALYGTYVSHQHIALIMLSVLSVYAPWKMKLNVFMLGDFGLGKSFSIAKLIQLMIDCTYESLHDMSSKADHVGSSYLITRMVRFFEEFKPSAWGGDQSSKGKGPRTGGAKDSAMTDSASEMRALLTGAEISFKRLAKNEEGKFVREGGNIEAHVIFVCAANAVLSDLAGNMRSRFHMANCHQKGRINDSILHKYTSKVPPVLRPNKEEFGKRYKRNQGCIAIWWALVEVGLQNEPNTTLSDSVLLHVLGDAAKRGMGNAEDIRNFERASMLTVIVALWDALNQWMDGPKSPLKNAGKWNWTHFIIYNFEDWVRPNQAHAAFALEMLSDAWEDPLMYEALRAFKRTYKTELKASIPGIFTMADFEDVMTQRAARDDKVREGEDASRQELADNLARAQEKVDGLRADVEQAHADGEEPSVKLKEDLRQAGLALAAWQKRIEKSTERVEKRRAEFKATGEQMREDEKTKQVEQRSLLGMLGTYAQIPFVDKTPYASDATKIHKLANELISNMAIKPSHGQLVGFLTELLTIRVPDAGSEDRLVPALQFTEGQLSISRDLLAHNEEKRMRRSLERCLQLEGFERKTYVYGTVMPGHPFAWETYSTVGVPSKGRLRLRNPYHIERTVVAFMQRCLAASDNAADLENSLRNGLRIFNDDDSSQDVPFFDCDCDIGEYMLQARLAENLRTAEQLDALGYFDRNQMPRLYDRVAATTELLIPKNFEAALLATRTFAKLFTYPEMFDSIRKDAKAAMELDARQNPWKYSLKNRMLRMIKDRDPSAIEMEPENKKALDLYMEQTRSHTEGGADAKLVEGQHLFETRATEAARLAAEAAESKLSAGERKRARDQLAARQAAAAALAAKRAAAAAAAVAFGGAAAAARNSDVPFVLQGQADAEASVVMALTRRPSSMAGDEIKTHNADNLARRKEQKMELLTEHKRQLVAAGYDPVTKRKVPKPKEPKPPKEAKEKKGKKQKKTAASFRSQGGGAYAAHPADEDGEASYSGQPSVAGEDEDGAHSAIGEYLGARAAAAAAAAAAAVAVVAEKENDDGEGAVMQLEPDASQEFAPLEEDDMAGAAATASIGAADDAEGVEPDAPSHKENKAGGGDGDGRRGQKRKRISVDLEDEVEYPHGNDEEDDTAVRVRVRVPTPPPPRSSASPSRAPFRDLTVNRQTWAERPRPAKRLRRIAPTVETSASNASPVESPTADESSRDSSSSGGSGAGFDKPPLQRIADMDTGGDDDDERTRELPPALEAAPVALAAATGDDSD